MTALKILLVEDNPVNQTYLQAIILSVSHLDEKLEQRKISVTVCADLKEALNSLDNQTPDIILLDLTLPDSYGLNTFKQIKLQSPLIPVIILTGIDDMETALEAVKMGAQDYLVKGKVDKLLLYRSIHYAIQRSGILAALKESEERYALALQATNDGIWEWNVSTNKVYYSRRWAEILGLNPKELSDNPDEWFNRIHPEDTNRVEDELHTHLSGATAKLFTEHRLLHKNGSYIWVRVRGMALKDDHGSVQKVAGSLIDITAERLQDALTGLPNKVLFMDRLQSALKRVRHSRAEDFVVFIVELENYKLISSNFGPSAAEVALTTCSERLISCIRETDTIARTGASEFGIILYNNPDVVVVDKIATDIHRTMGKPLQKEEGEFSITVGIGIVFVTATFENEAEIYRDGVNALQKALQKGRGSSEIYDLEMRTKTMNILQMEGKLLRAIERYEFILNYQPIVSFHEKKLSSLEALIRWESEGKRVSPVEFIPIAEETDMIIRLGAWVIEEAMLQMQRWRLEHNLDVTIALNFSLRQFKNTQIIDYLKKSLSMANIPHEKFIIEVTESIAMENIEYSRHILNDLSGSGFTISIDDFGTGYSSFSYLKKFPIQKLKIDKSFVSEIPHDTDSKAIISAMIQMAHALGYKVVVEGIENEEQYNFCKNKGADFAQGYYISKPLEAEKVPEFLETYLK